MAFGRLELFLVTLCLLFSTHSLLADTVHLKNGKEMKGEVIKEDKDTVVVRVQAGEVTLRASEVDYIDYETAEEYSLNLSRELLQQNRVENAISVLQKALEKSKNSTNIKRALAGAFAAQGKRLIELKRLQDARNIFENLRKMDPDGTLVPGALEKGQAQIDAADKQIDTLIENARSLAKTDLSAAIVEFEHAMDLSPDSRSKVASDLARCHVQRAVALHQNNRELNASVDLEEALELDPRLGDALERLYISCALPAVLEKLHKAEFDAAQTELKRIHKISPANRNVLYLEGRLEEDLGHYPEACAFYSKGLRTRVGNPTPQYAAELREKLEAELGIKAGQWQIETGFAQIEKFADSEEGPAQKLETENFTIFHHNEALAREAADSAEFARDAIVDSLKLKPWHGKAMIFIYRTQAEYTMKTGQPEWTGGVSQYMQDAGRTSGLSIHSWQTSPRLLKSVLPHEITHLLMGSSLIDYSYFPMALHEGVAVLMEPQYRQDYFLDFLKIRFKSQSFIPLAELLAARAYPKDPEFFYAEGFSIIQYLVEKKGMSVIFDIVKNSGYAGAWEQALLNASGTRSLDELETDWKAWIGAKVK